MRLAARAVLVCVLAACVPHPVGPARSWTDVESWDGATIRLRRRKEELEEPPR